MVKELVLIVFTEPDGTFEVFRSYKDPAWIHDSILVLDYNYTPWVRENGNLLWQ